MFVAVKFSLEKIQLRNLLLPHVRRCLNANELVLLRAAEECYQNET